MSITQVLLAESEPSEANSLVFKKARRTPGAKYQFRLQFSPQGSLNTPLQFM